MVHLKQPQRTIGTAHVLISRSCVNNCIFCAVAEKRKAREFPEKEEIIRFMKKCSDSGVSSLIFSGLGEPTLDIHFEEYLDIAHELGFQKICLFTNGYGLSMDKAYNWKLSGLSEVLLSMHGIEEGHDRNVQRKGSFREAVQALDLYSQLNYSISINTCLTRYNLDEISRLRQLLSHYPIRIHTLSFPEWDGNTQYYVDWLVDYEEVATNADKLVEPGNEVTVFDNIPYCLVKRDIREMRGLSPIQYLDGKGETELFPNAQKLYPEVCQEKKCPFISICPGFEKNYIAARGWGGIKEKILSFLNSVASNNGAMKSISEKIHPSISLIEPREKNGDKDYFHKDDICLVVKPTNRCNGDCHYCSSYSINAPSDMNEDILEKMYDELFDYARAANVENITMLWHGGEPLLMGKKFYRKAWEKAIEQKVFRMRHLIQTNLLSVDEEWIELFTNFDVYVSTSVDPIGHARTYKDGRLQYPDWINNFTLMCSSNVKVGGVVFTVTSKHMDRIEELYCFFKNIQSLASREIGIKFNPVCPAGKANTEKGNVLGIQPSDFGLFLSRLWDYWNRDGRPFPISPFSEWAMYGQLSCEFSGACHEHFLSIDGEGNIYHCGRFSDSGLPLGNMHENTLTSIMTENLWRRQLFKRKAALQSGHCMGCELWEYCGGGCPYFADLYFSDPLAASPLCEATKTFFKRISINSLVPLKKEVRYDSVSP